MADTVLVVDDDAANSLLVETILTHLGGFEVICSDDGDEILDLVASRPINAALMDVSLKNTRILGEKVDGVELTRRIRDVPGCSGLPVILLTAHAMKGDREHLLFSSGANDYVAKPIADQNELVELVRRHIRTASTLENDGDGG
jgi:CheY-like chemotaxis protein